jgi:hypothetical protein
MHSASTLTHKLNYILLLDYKRIYDINSARFVELEVCRRKVGFMGSAQNCLYNIHFPSVMAYFCLNLNLLTTVSAQEH